jgi:hypothetical protein
VKWSRHCDGNGDQPTLQNLESTSTDAIAIISVKADDARGPGAQASQAIVHNRQQAGTPLRGLLHHPPYAAAPWEVRGQRP